MAACVTHPGCIASLAPCCFHYVLWSRGGWGVSQCGVSILRLVEGVRGWGTQLGSEPITEDGLGVNPYSMPAGLTATIYIAVFERRVMADLNRIERSDGGFSSQDGQTALRCPPRGFSFHCSQLEENLRSRHQSSLHVYWMFIQCLYGSLCLFWLAVALWLSRVGDGHYIWDQTSFSWSKVLQNVRGWVDVAYSHQ